MVTVAKSSEVGLEGLSWVGTETLLRVAPYMVMTRPGPDGIMCAEVVLVMPEPVGGTRVGSSGIGFVFTVLVAGHWAAVSPWQRSALDCVRFQVASES